MDDGLTVADAFKPPPGEVPQPAATTTNASAPMTTLMATQTGRPAASYALLGYFSGRYLKETFSFTR
jgi:hypothetical protein